jgi:mersacidin/lichenicidin family type 2 lantibiotic
MSNVDVVRAWKDRDYRQSLSEAQQSALPAHPAGVIELAEDDLQGVGGYTSNICVTISISVTISQLISCWDSIAHGGCGGFSIGDCGPLHPTP